MSDPFYEELELSPVQAQMRAQAASAGIDPTMSAKQHGFPKVYIHGQRDRVGQLWHLDPHRADVVFAGNETVTVRPCDLTIAAAGTGTIEDSQTLGQQ